MKIILKKLIKNIFTFSIIAATCISFNFCKKSGNDTTQQIPTLDNLSANWQQTKKLLSLPSVNNFYGGLETDRNLLSISHLSLPPLILGGGSSESDKKSVPGAASTGILYINDSLFEADESRWYPYQVLRRKKTASFELNTNTRMVFEGYGVLQTLSIKNTSSQNKSIDIKVDFNGGLRKVDKNWLYNMPFPTDASGFISNIEALNKIIFVKDSLSSACIAFTFDLPAQDIQLKKAGATAAWKLNLKPGEEKIIRYITSLGTDKNQVITAAAHWSDQFQNVFDQAKKGWEQRYTDAFTPGNKQYSGNLPTLETKDLKIKRLYYMSVVSLLQLQRTNFSGYKNVFVTCSPRTAGTVVYFWDMSFDSNLWGLLDPVSMKAQLKLFLQMDIHSCYAVDFIEKKPVGPWYSANDQAIFTMVSSYLRVTGDYDFLKEICGDKTVQQHLEEIALFWKTRQRGNSILADYGDAENLLECVGTYTNKVPSFNAANVWIMRSYADILDRTGNKDKAQLFRTEANKLSKAVLSLYVPGKGYWCCQNKNSCQEVRHCIDFFTVSKCIPADINPQIRKEMINFAETELIDGSWMHALSAKDISTKPDYVVAEVSGVPRNIIRYGNPNHIVGFRRPSNAKNWSVSFDSVGSKDGLLIFPNYYQQMQLGKVFIKIKVKSKHKTSITIEVLPSNNEGKYLLSHTFTLTGDNNFHEYEYAFRKDELFVHGKQIDANTLQSVIFKFPTTNGIDEELTFESLTIGKPVNGKGEYKFTFDAEFAAVSPGSDRTDHGPKGAYMAWPAFTIEGLFNFGEHKKALDFLRRTEKLTWEGPFGQAYRYVNDTTILKAQDGQDYSINSGGVFADLIINTFFGFYPDYTGKKVLRNDDIPRGFSGTMSNVNWKGKQVKIVSDEKGVHLSND